MRLIKRSVLKLKKQSRIRVAVNRKCNNNKRQQSCLDEVRGDREVKATSSNKQIQGAKADTFKAGAVKNSISQHVDEDRRTNTESVPLKCSPTFTTADPKMKMYQASCF